MFLINLILHDIGCVEALIRKKTIIGCKIAVFFGSKGDIFELRVGMFATLRAIII